MTTRIRYAVQYPPREPGGEPLYLKWPFAGGDRKTATLENAMTSETPFEHLTANTREPPDSDHLPARVVQVRETITREVVE